MHAPRHIFIHAGVVRSRGVGIVLPGSSFSGKTTLVAALVRAGADYYSDEFAVVDKDGLIHAYRNPLVHRGDRRPGSPMVPVLVPDSQLGVEPVRAALIVATSYEEAARWRPTVWTPAQGAIALLQHTLAARSQSDRALATVRRVADRSHVLAGRRGESDIAASELLQTIESLVSRPVAAQP
jgi:hypothetical protein